MPIHSNINTLKNDNLSLIFKHLRKENKSRAELSKETGLTRSAVTMITNQLIDEGILYEIGFSQSAKGRKPILLSIVSDYKYAVGVILERNYISVVITNLKNDIIGELSSFHFSSYSENLNWIENSINHLLSISNLSLSDIIGIGISSPGPVDFTHGIILTPPNFNIFHNKHIVSDLKEKFNLPIFLENNAVLLAITDYFKNPENYNNNSMFITFSGGIGSCILQNGRIFRGFLGFAGEIGHTSVNPDGLKCSCGNTGCLELYALLPALKKRFLFDDYNEIVDLAYTNDEKSLDILKYLANILSFSLTNAINLLDLNEIILYGELCYKSDLLISLLKKNIQNQSIISKTHDIEIYTSTLPENAYKIASVSSLLNKFFEQKI